MLSTLETHRVGEVPVRVRRPRWRRPRGIVLWLPYLTGTAVDMDDALSRAARAGFIGVSLDPRRHGARADATRDDLHREVMGAFRRTMWPILGGTAEDARDVITWATGRFGVSGPVYAGGLSMGGDIAVALAGIDPRVQRVVSLGSTPDWTRPGMTVDGDPARPIDQGEPDQAAQAYYDAVDPITHPAAFDRQVEIRFHVGERDTHVPAEAAQRFAALLAGSRAHVEVRPVVGFDHASVVGDRRIRRDAIAWLVRGGSRA
ncbi:MAG: hypothetical protein CSA58_13085, partial [Micrococcales bacterium]